MKWALYAAMAAVMLAAADLSVKAAAGRISPSLGLALYGGTAFLAGLLWCGWRYLNGQSFYAETAGVIAALCVGAAFSLVVVGLYLTFEVGAPLSVASPTIRTGGLVLASLVGLLVLREPITARYVLGALLALAGIYLLASAGRAVP